MGEDDGYGPVPGREQRREVARVVLVVGQADADDDDRSRGQPGGKGGGEGEGREGAAHERRRGRQAGEGQVVAGGGAEVEQGHGDLKGDVGGPRRGGRDDVRREGRQREGKLAGGRALEEAAIGERRGENGGGIEAETG